jgi:hypothetical protein
VDWHASKNACVRWVACCAVVSAALADVPTAQAATIVNDSWADGGRNDGADPLDSNWWTSASPQGIEVSTGSLGMVTGSSGRGIHTIFPTQTLNINDRLIVTYTFTTPATVASGATAAFRVGLFDTLERAGLNADVVSSSASPNSLYGYHATNTPGLPGYMLDMDIRTFSDDLNFRQHDTVVNGPSQTPTGRLMGTTTGFTNIPASGPDGVYILAPQTTFTGSLTVKRINATEMQIIGVLGSATHSVTDSFDSADFGMLAFWANADAFGTSGSPGEQDNGIDFSNVRIEIVPEPDAPILAMFFIALAVGARRP